MLLCYNLSRKRVALHFLLFIKIVCKRNFLFQQCAGYMTTAACISRDYTNTIQQIYIYDIKNLISYSSSRFNKTLQVIA